MMYIEQEQVLHLCISHSNSELQICKGLFTLLIAMALTASLLCMV